MRVGRLIWSIFLAASVVSIQYPLWFSQGGGLSVAELHRQLKEQQQINADWIFRNAVLEAELQDLRTNGQAVEERARYELGLVKPGEIFVQIDDSVQKEAQPGQVTRSAQ